MVPTILLKKQRQGLGLNIHLSGYTFYTESVRITYLSPYQQHANNGDALGSPKTFALNGLLRDGGSSQTVQHL